MHPSHDADRPAHASENLLSSTTAPIQVCLFGGLTLLKEGRPVGLRGGARSEALFLSLAVAEKRGVSRERLLTQVWPESDAALAVQSLHSLVHSLHGLLGGAMNGEMPIVHA